MVEAFEICLSQREFCAEAQQLFPVGAHGFGRTLVTYRDVTAVRQQQADQRHIADTCTDDGKYYNITLKFIDGTDPTNTGVATSFNIIRGEDVKAAAKVVSDFSSDYYDAVITCKIDKATGNLVSANYKLPIVMHVKAMGVDAQVGMTFIHDYTINW